MKNLASRAAINGALYELQAEGIAAIPQTNAILCKPVHQERVREVIGQWMSKESTGVHCKVNGVSTASGTLAGERVEP